MTGVDPTGRSANRNGASRRPRQRTASSGLVIPTWRQPMSSRVEVNRFGWQRVPMGVNIKDATRANLGAGQLKPTGEVPERSNGAVSKSNHG